MSQQLAADFQLTEADILILTDKVQDWRQGKKNDCNAIAKTAYKVMLASRQSCTKAERKQLVGVRLQT